MEALLAGGERLVVEVDDAARALAALQGAPGVRGAEAREGRLLVDAAPETAAAVNRRLVESGIAVSGLVRQRSGLEERFLAITEGEA
jgi:hypothetical protein